jgi:hypothetical protein
MVGHVTSRRRPQTAVLLVLAAALALALSACGGSSPSSKSASADNGSTTGASTTATSSTGTQPSTGTSTGTTGKNSTGNPPNDPSGRRTRSRKAVAPGQGQGNVRRRRIKVGASKLHLCLSKYGIHSLQPGNGVSREKLRTALSRCAAGGIQRRKQRLANPAYQAALKSFASCMRANGVKNFPEPNTSGNGPIFGGQRLARSPQMQSADKACIHILAAVRG